MSLHLVEKTHFFGLACQLLDINSTFIDNYATTLSIVLLLFFERVNFLYLWGLKPVILHCYFTPHSAT